MLLAAFAFVESRVPQPLLPPRLIADRTRGGAYLSVGLAIFQNRGLGGGRVLSVRGM